VSHRDRFLSAAAALAVAACAGASTPAAMPAPSAGAKLYVVNQSGASITVIDQDRLAVDTTIDLTKLGFSANAKPHHIAVEPDGSAWYASLIGDGRVLKFDRANRLVGQVAMETPGLLMLDPRHDTLFVGRSMTAPNPPKSLDVIRRSTFSLVDEQEVEIPRPHALVTTRDGRWTHTASLAENRIASVDAVTGRVTLTTLPGVFRSLVQFTVSPDGKTMVAGGELSNTVLLFDLTRPPPLTVAKEVQVGGKPWDPAFSPDGKSVYFSLFADNQVVELDVASGTVKRRITGDFAQPYDLIMRHDGKYLFVVNQNTGAKMMPGQSAHDNMPGMGGMAGSAKDGWLSVINVATGRVEKVLPLGPSPTGMGAAGAR
jgi:DNA-binding beta-propeller fold protein YncE